MSHKTKMRLSCNSIALVVSSVKHTKTNHRKTYIRKSSFFQDAKPSYGKFHRGIYE